MITYARVYNSTCTTTSYDYYNHVDASTKGDYYYGDYDVYSQILTEKNRIVIPKEKIIFNINKVSNINIKLKQKILFVNKQIRFTIRNAL